MDTEVGHYRIVKQTGETHLGSDFEAVDQRNGKRVTLKRLRPELVTDQVQARLRSEARSLALLNHPNIARIFGFIRRKEELFLILEFVRGEPVEKLVARNRHSYVAAVDFIQPIIAALRFAHGLGIVHGHLDPSKILMTDSGAIKILDLGLAHVFGTLRADSQQNGSQYLAPEQPDGAAADVRSDIYSLGVLLYELLVGKRPFETDGETPRSASTELVITPPFSFVSDLPKQIDDVVLQAMAPSPGDRFQSIQAMSQQMRNALAPKFSGASPLGRGRQEAAHSATAAHNVIVDSGRWCVNAGIRAMAAAKSQRAKATRALAKCATVSCEASAHFRQGSAIGKAASARVARHCRARFLEAGTMIRAMNLTANGRRYALNACLVGLLCVELFYFGGSNIYALLNPGQFATPSLNDAVDTMFAELAQQQPEETPPAPPVRAATTAQIERRSVAPAGRRVAVERTQRPDSVPAEKSGRKPDIVTPAEPAVASTNNKATNTNANEPTLLASAAEKQTKAPVTEPPQVREARQSAPAPSKSAQNSAARTLDVKWEN